MARATVEGSRLAAGLQHEDQLLEELDHQLGVRSFHRDAITLHHDLVVRERLLDLTQMFVARPEQPGHQVVARDEAFGAQGRGHGAFT